MKTPIIVWTTVGLIGFAASGRAAGIYTFNSIDFPGAAFTEPIGINSAGQIVGYYRDAAGATHGFLRSGTGSFSSIDFPGAPFTQAYGISSSGQIVGPTSNVADPADVGGPVQGYLLKDGEFTTIDFPGGSNFDTAAFGINDSGKIVGAYDAGGVQHGFLLSGSRFSTIDFPGAVDTKPPRLIMPARLSARISLLPSLHRVWHTGFCSMEAPSAPSTFQALCSRRPLESTRPARS